MQRIERTLTIHASFEEADDAQQTADEQLSPEERLQVAYELSVLAYGAPSRLKRTYRVVQHALR
jgi:hypothetical protein